MRAFTFSKTRLRSTKRCDPVLSIHLAAHRYRADRTVLPPRITLEDIPSKGLTRDNV